MPTVSMRLQAQSHPEGSNGIETTLIVEAILSAPSGKPVTAVFGLGTPLGPPAGLDSDFRLETNLIVIDAYSLYGGTPAITLLGDNLYEDDEQIELIMTSAVGATLDPDPTKLRHTITILNDDDKPTVYFVPASQAAPESVGEMYVHAVLDKVSGKDVVLSYGVSGSATPISDFTISPSPAAIPAGQTTTAITMTIVLDEDDGEGDETIVVTMTGVAGGDATIGSPSQHVATISSGLPLPGVYFTSMSQSVSESGYQATVAARLTFTTPAPVVVPLLISGTAEQGTDYTLSAGSITIPANSLNGSIIVNILEDGIYEGSETVILTMGTPDNAVPNYPSQHILTILDNEPFPRISFNVSSQTVNEDSGTATVDVMLSGPSSSTVTAPVTISPLSTAINGLDYNASISQVSIPAGSLSTSFTVEIIDDAVINEGTETAIFVLESPSNAELGNPSTHTLNIIDNDACPTAGMLSVPIGTSSKLTLYISHNSLGARDVTIDSVTIFWYTGLGQKLTSVYWGGSKIFDTSMTESPTMIPSQAPWLANANLNVPAGTSLRLFEVQYQKNLAGARDDYSMRIRFSNTCEIIR
jgi:hypothetical protein